MKIPWRWCSGYTRWTDYRGNIVREERHINWTYVVMDVVMFVATAGMFVWLLILGWKV